MFDSPLTTNDQSIDRVLAVGLPVLLVFLKGPAAPEIENSLAALARKHAGKLLVAKVQVVDNPETAQKYQITRTPALAAVSGGEVKSKTEAIAAEDLEQHALFLLGQGARPEPKQEPAPRSAESSSSQSQNNNGQSYSRQNIVNRPLSVNDASFEQQVMRSNLPVLVDFWAPWCGPCRMTDPILEKMAGEMAGRVLIAKVNVDENPQTAQRFDIRSIPTMMVVKDGRIVDRWMGALPEPNLRSRLSSALR
jgi:thioredoxin 1